ncbi:DUF2796 domain-containing protein [Hyphobacterium sp. SN044]|uniref:ZrgA family zinc uptake protein n=1 Tax=Hyphobacterium sp. SN044 TaxID=2912575 RepID=UPI001F3C3D5D|nr:DUF2796 domain-containing protein [Hyphobacterium sp. SN044]MCF8880255.1 DUF2796 domain-containing protein [Hyphobacterium sp. SN044]
MPGVSLIALLLASAQAGHAHVHGHGNAAIAVSRDGQVEAEFVFPGDTLYGFEREPQTDAEVETVRAAHERLNNPAALLRFNPQAGCSAIGSRTGGGGDAGAHSHHDITITVRFQCERPERITAVGTEIFALFPRIEEIDGVLVTDTDQTSFVWTPSQTDYRLR